MKYLDIRTYGGVSEQDLDNSVCWEEWERTRVKSVSSAQPKELGPY